jgi:Fe-S-cluster-containing dehydrogenase component
MVTIYVVKPTFGRLPIRDLKTDCTGCEMCVSACSWFKEGVVSPSLSRIKVRTELLKWAKGERDNVVERTICKQCPVVAPCMSVCPVDGALDRDEETGAVVVNDELCIRCDECVEICPYDAIWHNEKLDRILKCDLCGGAPKCVEWCPVGCLKYEKIM